MKRVTHAKVLGAATTHRYDFLDAYTSDLASVIDFDVIRSANIAMGVDPLGGAGVHYWTRIADRFRLDLTVVNDAIDPTFGFMSVDWNGQIRMDPSSSYAMRGLIALEGRFRIALARDTDRDRHGFVTRARVCFPPTTILRSRSSTSSRIGRRGASTRPWFMLGEALPIYSGGLGNVAGDQLKAASDLGVPVIGVGLLYQRGYFRQAIDQKRIRRERDGGRAETAEAKAA